MYKLTVVSGPNAGTSYALKDGDTSIGRQSGNVIVLQSSKVSKNHCMLRVANGDVVIEDQNSSNGTFVNGTLTKHKQIQPGDKISVGEFVLELAKPTAHHTHNALPAVGIGSDNVLAFPQKSTSQTGTFGASEFSEFNQPKTLKSKIAWLFESYVMPFFYKLNLTNEWKTISVFIVGCFLLVNLVISVFPLLQANHMTVLNESAKRARIIAKQIVEANSNAIANESETKTRIGISGKAVGVRVAKILDLKSRIIAPTEELNRYFTHGSEATFVVKMATAFAKGRENGATAEVSDGIVAAIEPIKVFDPRYGKNVVTAMALVSIDANIATMSAGEIGMVYSKVFIITTLFCMFFFFVLYRMTLKPLELLNNDLDRALKGEIQTVKQDFKFSEVASLWDLVNSAIHRIPRENMHEFSGNQQDHFEGPEEFLSAFETLGSHLSVGLAVCNENKKILYLNPVFEELSGIHSSNAVGSDFSEVARDQALVALCEDIFERALPGQSAIEEDFDFSGVGFKIYGSALGKLTTRGYVIFAKKEEV